jgi:prolyl 4-hydroxylase
MNVAPSPAAPLSDDWMAWIRTNLQRGCRTGDLADTLRQHGFGDERIAAAIERFRNQPLPVLPANTPPPPTPDAAYVYEPSRIPKLNRIVLSDRTVHVTARTDRPDVVAIDNLLSPEECDILVEASRIKMQRSLVVNPETGIGDVSPVRTSSGTYFKPGELDIIPAIEARIAELTGLPASHGEGLQILNYQVGGEYLPHFDYFPPKDSGSTEHLSHGGQRVATLLLYLNDVEAGGETSFPSAGNLRVTPRKGSAVYFAYFNSHGQLDPATLHAGTPVTQGEKWLATKWIRQRPWA